MLNVFFLAAGLITTIENMYRANRGATIWGRMTHPKSGMIPATITKIGPGSWELKLHMKNPLKASESHPGFPFRFTDREAFDWVHHNAYIRQPR